MYDEERAASRAAAALIERELDARSSRVWARCLLLLPWPSEWPPRPASSWTRIAFALGPPRTSIRDGVEQDHVHITRAWGRVRHVGSLRAAPVFEAIGPDLHADGDADVARRTDTSTTTPSVGELLVRASAGPLTPADERRLAGAYLANLDRVACTVPHADLEAHRDFLAWLDRWRKESPPWVGHDPSDLFFDPIGDRLAASAAKEKQAAADIDAELAALKAKL